MAKTKVFTITVQNQPGAVAAIAKALGSAKVNILALLGTTQGTAGTVQLVAEDAKRAKKALDDAKLAYQETGAEQPGDQAQLEASQAVWQKLKAAGSHEPAVA